MDINSAYWQGKEPKNSQELRDQIKNALLALKQWKDAANIPNTENSVMIDAQIYWLEELLKLSNVELKS
ncbi:MAG: hypothetical protein A2171_02765 [Candidatus Levybacteria bacterium RBG_13_35_9]|nr:MAG: hypothetical protein A2171_02765 [Candidatus Levybacteria bacterium RBG_13_35_9]